MSDVMPKAKMYIFISIIILFINLGCFLVTCINNNTLDFVTFVLSAGGSFIPFVSFVQIAISGLDTTIKIFIDLFTGILTGLQTFILAMILLQVVHNIIWSPDV